MKTKKLNQYKYGRGKEQKVLEFFKNLGWNGSLNPGSKGSADIKLSKGSKKWVGQIKASRKGKPPGLTKKEQIRLKIKATKNRAVPVSIQLVGSEIVNIESVRSGRRLKP